MNGKHVLLVEDDPFLRRASEAGLRKRGYTVTAAVDGEQALQLINKSIPDLVLLDLLMPRVSGMEVLMALKGDERTRAIPVVILTNSSAEPQMRQAMDLGATGYLVKADLSLRELGDHVAKILGE